MASSWELVFILLTNLIPDGESSFTCLEDSWNSAAKGNSNVCTYIFICVTNISAFGWNQLLQKQWYKWKIMSMELSVATKKRFRFVLSKRTWVVSLWWKASNLQLRSALGCGAAVQPLIWPAPQEPGLPKGVGAGLGCYCGHREAMPLHSSFSLDASHAPRA